MDLKDDDLLGNVIRDQGTLMLRVRTLFEVIIDHGRNKVVRLLIEGNDTIDDIKIKLRVPLHVRQPQNIHLYMDKLKLLGSRKAVEYGIEAKTVLNAVLSFNISVSFRLDILELNVQETDTITDVKVQIHERVGVPAKKLALYHADKYDKNGHKLYGCVINDNEPMVNFDESTSLKCVVKK